MREEGQGLQVEAVPVQEVEEGVLAEDNVYAPGAEDLLAKVGHVEERHLVVDAAPDHETGDLDGHLFAIAAGPMATGLSPSEG